ncbi:L-2-hydroxyglutarate dehydrogenase, mitochondrial isoform X2 [Solanum stenotomum]|uniref:L-2-hydroxyglutarate dehydrogenase, mitochondrial isoform X2 n=1 Tax=Solanum stenotomum TaxID=172797 RepID=UPI0020D14908|nr:L-2-hydroxyglutarate dehydrogenase, mitochondrial isoform X2 [Solanum stenotomum]
MMKPINSITKTIFQKFKNVSNPRKPPFSSSLILESIPREKVDCLVIGAGIVGIAVAKELSVNHGRQVLVLDSAPIFGTGASSRNSEVIHAGIYYPTNSLKASFCVRGKELLYKYCKDHEIPHKQIGKLIVATGLSEVPRLSALMNRGVQNGVEGLRMMEGYEATILEPELQCVKALWSPSSGIVDSHSLMLSLVGEAESHGTTFSYNTAVIGGHIEGNQIQIHVSGSNAIANWNGSSELDSELILIPKLVVNSAGLSAPAIAKRMKGLPDGIIPASHYARGCYFTLSNTKSPFKHLIYPIPEVGGLGVHVTLDLNGQVKFGPDVEWIEGIDDISSFLNMFDYSVREDRANQFYPAIRKYYPSLKDRSLEPGYAGIRPKLSGPEEGPTDFVVQGEDIHGISGLVNLFGIESPGLTSSMAIAEHVAAKLLK